MQRRIICGTAFSMGISIFGVILAWFIIPPIVSYLVDQNVILYENSDQFDRFVNIPQPLHFKVYFFNVTNVDRIQAGEMPRVREIGPYVFSQYRKKTIHNVSQDKVYIQYTQDQRFIFNTAESGDFKEDDHIVVLNIPLNALLHIVDKGLRRGAKYLFRGVNDTLERIPIFRTVKHLLETIRGNRRGVLQTLEDQMPAMIETLSSSINSMFGHPRSMFIRTTPRILLFGGIQFCNGSEPVANIMCNILRAQKLNTMQEMPDRSVRFALFKYKNETNDGFYTVHSGVNDPLQAGDIKAWQNSSTLTTWKSEPDTCNRIAGTDAGMFPPHRKQEGSINIFSTDICRTVEIFYEKETVYGGIPGLRFGTTDSFLNEIGPEHRTDCFCTDSLTNTSKKANGCLMKGALDLTPCHGAPIVLTQPHMMGADPQYQKVIGLRPDSEKHRTFVDIEPNTGYPLRGGKRVQFNMFIKPFHHINITRNLQSVLFPILWVDEGINLNDKMIKMLNDKLFNYLFMLDVLTWSMIVGGIVSAIVLVTWTIYEKQQSNKIYVFT